MLTISGIQTVIANSFFDGSLEIAGLIMYAVALALVMALTYKGIGAMGSILLGLPVTIVFNALGVVSGEATNYEKVFYLRNSPPYPHNYLDEAAAHLT